MPLSSVSELSVTDKVVFETFSTASLEDGQGDENLNTQVEDSRQEIAGLKKQLVVLKDRIKINESEYDALIENTQAEQKGLNSKIKDLMEEREKLLKRLAKLTEKEGKSEARGKELSDKNLHLRAETDRKSANIAVLNRSEIKLLETIDKYEEQRAEFESQIAELNLTIRELQKVFAEETKNSQILTLELKEGKEKSAKTLAAIQAQMQYLEKTLNDCHEELAGKQVEIKELEKKIEKLKDIVTVDSLFKELEDEYPFELSNTEQLAETENVQHLYEITYRLPEKIIDNEAENNKIAQIKERLKQLHTPAMKDRVEMRAILEDIKTLAETNPTTAAKFLTDQYKSKHIGLYIAELMKENPKATESLTKFYIAIMYKLIDSKHIEKFRALDILFNEFSIQLAKNSMKIPDLLEFFSRSLVLMADKKNPSVSKIIFNTISAMLDKKKSQNNSRNFYNSLKHTIPCDISLAPEQIFKSLINFINFAPMSPKRELAKRFQKICRKHKTAVNKVKLEDLEFNNARAKILTEIKSCLAADCLNDQEEIMRLEKTNSNFTEESKPKNSGFISFFRLSKSWDTCQFYADIDESLQKDSMGSRRPMTL